ncbi:Putative dioxygenase C576,01c [Talaromyces islandicus]|uniref:Putative dioxygenase C576,01c n=1 Tax=Talaromyces islandicus TaxID=28573 RepID=A0A0U1M7R4_TALIS|nr:Putative dioxygenase C576,01c [Talaromyces islandicus]
MAKSAMNIRPLKSAPGSAVDFGVEIDNVDLENITDEEFAAIHKALYHEHIVLFKNQQNLSPHAQYEFTKRFDPAAADYGHNINPNNARTRHLKSVPDQPQVLVKGNGFVESILGLENVTLWHPMHRRFHRDHIPEDKDASLTRFFRWHIDAALYDRNPPKVTTLMAVQVPKGPRQTISYDDGSGDTLDASLAPTAFVSGQNMFDMLSPEDQEFVRTSRVEYAPYPYMWMSKARAFSNGLGLYSEGLEREESELPPIDPSKIQILPMAWKNPVTGKLSLQVHPACVRKIHLADGSVIDDLERVRDIVYRLQRPAISPPYVYAHDWANGDMILFNNHGVLHTVVGSLRPDQIRVFRQCNLAASEPPAGP